MRFEHGATALWFKHLLRLGQYSWWSLLLWLVVAAPARAELEMRVAIEQDEDQVVLGGSTPTVVKDLSGQVLAQIPAGTPVVAVAAAGGVAIEQFQTGGVWVEPADNGYVAIGDERTKWYRGRALVVPTSSGVTAVNYVNLEHYLYSVVGSEMPISWHPEALKAQAVAARSYALYQRQTSANTVFDVGDTARWQVYGGVAEEASSTIAAVNATAGQVLTHSGRIIEAVFHSSSGGCTENVENVWVQPLPYLRSVPDFDQDAVQWQETVSVDRLRQLFPDLENIVALAPGETTACGRARTVRAYDEDQRSQEIDGDDFRRELGLKSTLITEISRELSPVASTEAINTPPVSFQISGRGYGHGLGMSQYGADALARQGYTYQQIVSHYFTGAVLSRIQVR
jgi:stage II sporulation protein D